MPKTRFTRTFVLALGTVLATPVLAWAQSSTVITSPALGGGQSAPSTGAPVTSAPTPLAPPVVSESLPADPAARSLVRIQQLEAMIQTLTGRVEEVQFQNSQLQQRLDRLQKDVDLRFQEIEQRPAAAATAEAPAAGQGANGAATAPASGAVGSSDGAQPPGNLRSPSGSAAKSADSTPAKPAGSVQDQYEQAFALLRAGDNEAAEKALTAFVQTNGSDPLASNAQYWIAQSQYSRGEYERAAVNFLQGYQKYPKGAKGADTMLGLGQSLAQLGKKKEACAAFGRLNEYPTAPDIVKRKATAERQKLGC